MCAILELLDRQYSGCSCLLLRLARILHAQSFGQWHRESLMSDFLVSVDESSPSTDLTLLSTLLLASPLSALVSRTRRLRLSRVLAKLA